MVWRVMWYILEIGVFETAVHSGKNTMDQNFGTLTLTVSG